MSSDSVNVIYTGQKSTKKGLCRELERYFRSIKAIDLCQQEVTINCHPIHDLPQTCRGIKYVCPVCVWPTEN